MSDYYDFVHREFYKQKITFVEMESKSQDQKLKTENRNSRLKMIEEPSTTRKETLSDQIVSIKTDDSALSPTDNSQSNLFKEQGNILFLIFLYCNTYAYIIFHTYHTYKSIRSHFIL